MSSRARLALPSRYDQDARLGRRVRSLGTAGAMVGIFVGVVDAFVGASIRPWVGDKQDTTGLGIATILLSLIALAAAVGSATTLGRSTGRRLVAAAGLLVPAALCFTTAGRLWYAPGAVLVGAGVMALAWAHRSGHVMATVERGWLPVLTTALAGFYVLLGWVAWGVEGGLGIVGGALIITALTVRQRSGRLAMLLLLVGALPFAVVTWWSVVTPLMALLVLLLGGLAVRNRVGDPPPRVRSSAPVAT